MRINANISALNAARNLSVSQMGLQKSLEKLSSGFRINRAADDAAGLAISEGLRSEIRGNTQAQRNAQDGISFIQTAEGALNEVASMLQRMNELAVQASGKADVTAEQAETDQLVTAIADISSNTTFGGVAVFGASKTLQIGANAGDTTAVATTALASMAVTLGAPAAITTVQGFISTVSANRADLGATQNTLEHTVSNLGVAIENLTASESRVRDVDMAAEMVTFTKNQILSQAGTAMLAQANQVPQGILRLLQ
jgi:flagellin